MAEIPPIPPLEEWLRVGGARYRRYRPPVTQSWGTPACTQAQSLASFTAEEREAAMAITDPENMGR